MAFFYFMVVAIVALVVTWTVLARRDRGQEVEGQQRNQTVLGEQKRSRVSVARGSDSAKVAMPGANGFGGFITPALAQIMFALLLTTSIFGGIYLISVSYGEPTIVAMGIGIMLLGPLVARLLAEGAVVVFQIHSTLNSIDAKLGRLESVAELETLRAQHDRQLQPGASEMQTRPSDAPPQDAPHS